ANSDFNAKAESALTEAQKAGGLSAETKEAVDKMALELNALREAEKTIKSAMGELEQHIAQMPLQSALKAAQSFGQQLISAEVLKDINSSIQGNKRISVPVQAALISTGVAEGVVEP
ncbi:TPA: phage major capsid protein, partial [Morganella morganii subsp. morganii]|nr:phage major capsid protein [Morganella morganii subsp. morganii]